ncbi:general stress protein CsbD [Dechloromonas denitrificans]|uniref:general stress protein CsbD n=1 Tax=Azonexaceae TaxID=2008795 RepID=UPI001CF8D1A6|nr:general stress protein CsbD [Dechloromonas denitrificans]UCV05569.1 general stress protein CsbD [Dechloromonas denitrificans]UCV09917.1 general stress protein CsbD [Dechloromonas denitrificans]
MSWDIDAESWKLVGVKIKSRWGKINQAGLAIIDGKRELLLGRIQELYAVSAEEAENQVASFEKHTKELRPKAVIA